MWDLKLTSRGIWATKRHIFIPFLEVVRVGKSQAACKDRFGVVLDGRVLSHTMEMGKRWGYALTGGQAGKKCVYQEDRSARSTPDYF